MGRVQLLQGREGWVRACVWLGRDSPSAPRQGARCRQEAGRSLEALPQVFGKRHQQSGAGPRCASVLDTSAEAEPHDQVRHVPGSAERVHQAAQGRQVALTSVSSTGEWRSTTALSRYTRDTGSVTVPPLYTHICARGAADGPEHHRAWEGRPGCTALPHLARASCAAWRCAAAAPLPGPGEGRGHKGPQLVLAWKGGRVRAATAVPACGRGGRPWAARRVAGG